MLNVSTDGSGDGRFGYVAMSQDNLETIDAKVVREEGITNNCAEYKAVILALRTFPNEDLKIYSDSQLVVNQLNHVWHIKSDNLRKLALLVWDLAKDRKVEFVWVPRKQNKAGKLLG